MRVEFTLRKVLGFVEKYLPCDKCRVLAFSIEDARNVPFKFIRVRSFPRDFLSTMNTESCKELPMLLVPVKVDGVRYTAWDFASQAIRVNTRIWSFTPDL